MNKIILTFCCLVFVLSSTAQNLDSLIIGKPFPAFELNEILYYPRKSMKVSDFKGQYLILDFFNKGCTACVASWPHTNEMQKQFKDKVQFFLAGESTPQKNWEGLNKAQQIAIMKQMYQSFRKKLSLEFPVALSTMAIEQLGMYTGPVLVWIDKSGIIKAITSRTGDLNEKNLDNFVNDKPVLSYNESTVAVTTRNENMRTYLDALYHNDSLRHVAFRSNISKWSDDLPIDYNSPRLGENGNFDIIGWDLASLYRLAYFNVHKFQPWDILYGKTIAKPVIEVKADSVLLADYGRADAKDRKFLFNYSLRMPSAKFTDKGAREMLITDLNRCFQYKSIIEKRMMPYWRLIISELARKKLMARSEDQLSFQEPIRHAGFTATVPVNSSKPFAFSIVTLIDKANKTDMPIIDETGINGLIHITIKANMEDFEDMRRAYHEQGLDLVKGYKMMDVLVIRDAEPEKK